MRKMIWFFVLFVCLSVSILITACDHTDSSSSDKSAAVDDDSSPPGDDDNDDDSTPGDDDDSTPSDDDNDDNNDNDDNDDNDDDNLPAGPELIDGGPPSAPRFAIGADGKMYVLSVRSRHLLLFIGAANGATWQSAVVAQAAASHEFVDYDLGVDSTGVVHIVYNSCERETLSPDPVYYLRWKGNPLSNELLIDNGTKLKRLRVDAAGHAYLLYFTTADNHACYGSNQTGTWSFAQLPITADDCDLAIDDGGHAHIVYIDLLRYYDYTLYYLTNATGDWQDETITDSSGWYFLGGTNFVIAVDGQSQPQVAAGRTYFSRIGGVWQSHLYGDLIPNGYDFNVDLALTPTGRARIAVYWDSADVYDAGLELVRQTDSDWSTTIFDTPAYYDGGGQLAFCRVALGPVGTAWVAYSMPDNTGNYLKVAGETDGFVAKRVLVQTEGEVNDAASGAVDASDGAQVAYNINQFSYGVEIYTTGGFSSLKYAANDGAGWQGTLIEQGEYYLGYEGSIIDYVGLYPTILLADDGSAGISYAVYQYNKYRDGIDFYCWDIWTAEPSGAGPGGENGLGAARRSDGALAQAFYYFPSDHFLCGGANPYNPATGLSVVVTADEGAEAVLSVEIDPAAVAGTAIAYDNDDDLHAAYFTATELRHAFGPLNDMTIETIAAVSQPGEHVALVMRGAAAHVAYLDRAAGELRHATNEGGAWTVETVDGGGVGQYPSLLVDPAGVIHIAYYDYTDQTLKYAQNGSGEWVAATLDPLGDVGKSTSIARDSQGRIHIFYTGLGALWRTVVEADRGLGHLHKS